MSNPSNTPESPMTSGERARPDWHAHIAYRPLGRRGSGAPGRRLGYSGGVGVSCVLYIACMSSSSWTVGPTTAMPRASMDRQSRV